MFLLFTNTFKLSIDISSYINFDQEPCLKIDNCCKEDIDCSYIQYTGGCYTLEYIDKINSENQKNGVAPFNVQKRENVFCI